MFLPRRLHREVGALAAPPVPREHAAFTPYKFGVEELRTTNLAESYHSQLNTLIEGDHPTLDKLILVLRDLEGEAQSALITFELNSSYSKHLRRKDRERRERIAHEMSSFDNNYHAGVSRLAVGDYCRKMARNVAVNTV
ncbi:hypothetical protein Aduo_012619 [Ancylostoma duodenale]